MLNNVKQITGLTKEWEDFIFRSHIFFIRYDENNHPEVKVKTSFRKRQRLMLHSENNEWYIIYNFTGKRFEKTFVQRIINSQ